MELSTSSSSVSTSVEDLVIVFENSDETVSEHDSIGDIEAHFSNLPSPLHWITLSDTIAVSPAAVPVLKAFCNSFDSHAHIHSPVPSNHTVPCRSKSVSHLDDVRRKHSDEEVKQMRDRLRNLARSRAIFSSLGQSQRLTLVAICFCYFVSYCAISVMAPFFLNEAKVHHISTTTYGLIFSVHPFLVFCTSPAIGHRLPSIGPKFMFVSGVFLCGTCNLLFGILHLIDDDTQFVVLCFVVRGLSAVGASAFCTAGATFVANLFPDKISAVMGILETFVGLGFSIGPVIGGTLYSLGGFKLPFFVLGTLMLATLPLNLCLLPSSDLSIHHHSGPRFLAILKNPAVLIVCLVIIVSSSAWSVLDPTLIIHMKQFDLPTVQLGLLFLLPAGSYAISSPFWGWLADKYDRGNLMMIIGLTITALSLLLLGPSPVFSGIPSLLWLNMVSLILLGIFDALAYLPTYQALLQYARDIGCDSQLSTYSTVAGLWASMYSLGEVLGPALGGSLMDLYNFPVVVTVVGFLNLAVAVLLLVHQTYLYGKNKLEASLASVSSGEGCGEQCDIEIKHKIKKVTFLSSHSTTDERQTLLNDHEEVVYGSCFPTE